MGLLNPHLEDDEFADVWSARTAVGAQRIGPPGREPPAEVRRLPRRATRLFASWLDDDPRPTHAPRPTRSFGARAPGGAAVPDLPAARVARASRARHRFPALRPPGRPFRPPAAAGLRRRQLPVARRRPWAGARVRAWATLIDEPNGLWRLSDPNRRSLQPSDCAATTRSCRSRRIAPSQLGCRTALQYLNAITPLSRDLDARCAASELVPPPGSI